MNKFLNILIFLIIFSLLNFSASSKQENYYYEVQFGNLIVGKAEVMLRLTSQNLNIDIKSQTAGILDVLYEYNGALKSSSIKNKDTWLPNKFSAGGVFNKKKRTTDITWVNNYKTVSYVNVPSIDLKKYHEVQKSSLINVIDPITAFMRVIEKINEEYTCDQNFKVFDGRRRYDLEIKTIGNSTIGNDRPKSYKGDVLICGLRVFPIGGHRLKTKWKPSEDKISDIKVYFGKNQNKDYVPVRVQIERWFGTVVIRLIRKTL